jgi:hypothetical protein
MGDGLWFIVHEFLFLMGYLFFAAMLILILFCRRFCHHGVFYKLNRGTAIA